MPPAGRSLAASSASTSRSSAAGYYYTALLRLIRRCIVLSPERVQYSPTLIWGPTLAALFLCSLPVIADTAAPVPGLPDWATPLISIGAWLVVPLLQILIWCGQLGNRGSDPRSRLGIDIISEIESRRDSEASQADRIALGGFAAMTDPALREAILGSAADSRWNARAWRRTVFRATAEHRFSPTTG